MLRTDWRDRLIGSLVASWIVVASVALGVLDRTMLTAEFS